MCSRFKYRLRPTWLTCEVKEHIFVLFSTYHVEWCLICKLILIHDASVVATCFTCLCNSPSYVLLYIAFIISYFIQRPFSCLFMNKISCIILFVSWLTGYIFMSCPLSIYVASRHTPLHFKVKSMSIVIPWWHRYA